MFYLGHIDVRQDDDGPVFRHLFAQGAPDTGAAAGDDDDFLMVFVDVLLLLRARQAPRSGYRNVLGTRSSITPSVLRSGRVYHEANIW